MTGREARLRASIHAATPEQEEEIYQAISRTVAHAKHEAPLDLSETLLKVAGRRKEGVSPDAES